MIRRFLWLVLLWAALCAAEQGKKAVVIPVSGVVDPGLRAFVKRATEQAVGSGVKVIVYKINTFGGEVESALEISDIITGVDSSVQTIAFVESKAISAGALIALSCNRLAMEENTTIGDCAPIAYSNDGPEMLGEKFQSPLRAKFRSLAKRNNYPSLLAEAMVSDDIGVLKIRKDSEWIFLSEAQYADMDTAEKTQIKEKVTVVRKGDLLTVDAHEAKDLGLAFAVIGSADELFQMLNLARPVGEITSSWSETMVRAIRKIAPVLLLIGMAGIGLEIKSPGLLWPGIVGVACLALVFGGQYLSGLANYGEILLFILGIALIVIEIHFIPGFGFAGVGGIVLVILSLVLSFQSFVIPKPNFPWQAAAMEKNMILAALSIIGGFVAFLLAARWLVSTGKSNPLVLKESQEGYQSGGDDLTFLAGQEGEADSILRPAGVVVINGARYDAVTEGGFIAKGRKIKVVQIQGNRVTVKEIA